jgi:hypothetical protein
MVMLPYIVTGDDNFLGRDAPENPGTDRYWDGKKGAHFILRDEPLIFAGEWGVESGTGSSWAAPSSDKKGSHHGVFTGKH